MSVYLSAVDDLLRHEGDNPSIGMILCRTKDNVFVEYALRDRQEITFTVCKEKNGSDFDDFSAADVLLHLCKEKSSIDESIFPLETVKVIF